MTEKFAFESDKISIALSLRAGLGDCIVTKKIFDALIELEPNCRIDLFCRTTNHIDIAKAFFGQSKNLNGIGAYNQIFEENIQKYDLVMRQFGTRAVVLQHVNTPKLQTVSPTLFDCLVKLDEYNRHNVIPLVQTPDALSLRNFTMSRILRKNLYYFISAGGALPVRDDKVNIPLVPEFKPQFDKLKLGRYITVYADIERDIQPPKIKTWPIQYLVEYVARMKKRYPSINVIQCGGGGGYKNP